MYEPEERLDRSNPPQYSVLLTGDDKMKWEFILGECETDTWIMQSDCKRYLLVQSSEIEYTDSGSTKRHNKQINLHDLGVQTKKDDVGFKIDVGDVGDSA